MYNNVGSGRPKHPLSPGYSLLDWQKVLSITSRPEQRAFSQKDLAESKYIALNGAVYDVSVYLDFHPGGKKILEVMRGKDATEQFARAHPWVNHERLLSKFKMGILRNDNLQ